MSKDKLLFNNAKTYEEFVDYMEELLSHVGKSYFNHDAYDQAIASLHTLDEEAKRKILDFANHVDSKMNYPSQSNKNRYHKVPTILAGAIYLDLYPDKVEGLSLEELQILAKHSVNLPLIFYKNATMYYTKELLAAINEIGPDFMYQSGYMYLAEKYFDHGKTGEEIAKYFLSTDPKQLFQEVFEYEQIMQAKIEQELANNESRRV